MVGVSSCSLAVSLGLSPCLLSPLFVAKCIRRNTIVALRGTFHHFPLSITSEDPFAYFAYLAWIAYRLFCLSVSFRSDVVSYVAQTRLRSNQSRSEVHKNFATKWAN
ncbi:hypothetical protein FPV67DRAFT_101358 [Lyophyllum atratum]|nr:hypothetical protein FPV67DRAFT_101358 [Lyophyllum atratum]